MKFEKLSIKKRMDNFKKRWLSKLMVRIISKKYAELNHNDPAELETILMEHSQQFKREITRKKYLKRKIGKQ
jgi:hypothetical protein